ncbi:MAG: hypothetical protein IKL74_01965 [Clostridia bacterium]|nr:hypothetical protein [Clostridia bacterium]
MIFSINSNGNQKHEEILKKRLSERLDAEFSDGGLLIDLSIDSSIEKAESFIIEEKDGGFYIKASDSLGLFYGIGKLLHSGKWESDTFSPIPTKGLMSPDCSFRATYVARHFYNFYDVAPMDEIERYLEDLLLWGQNTVILTLSTAGAKSYDDPLFKKAYEKIGEISSVSKALGLKIGVLMGNCLFTDIPEEIKALPPVQIRYRGNLGNKICPSKKGGMEYLKNHWKHQLEGLSTLDYIITWPYDEGGCGCSECTPWGSNKFCDMTKELYALAKNYFPDVKMGMSTWVFDFPESEGEYEGLFRRLDDDMAFVSFLMTDSHHDFPKYPLEHSCPRPIINFPEISMWSLYPWGGLGANPLPKRFQRIWDSSKHILNGGLPYSEGIYEDISKVQCLSYYWDKDKSYTESLSEYINYEYSSEVTVDCLELMEIIEENHTLISKCAEPVKVDRTKDLAESINSRLSDRAKKSWRWRILYIRAILDYKRYSMYLSIENPEPSDRNYLIKHTGEILKDDAEAQAMFSELIGYYHAVPHNGRNGWTLPPLGQTYFSD